MRLKKNQAHPERMDDEFFLGNMTDVAFKNSKWKTKRRGYVAYDSSGMNITSLGLFPAFVKQEDVSANGDVWHFIEM